MAELRLPELMQILRESAGADESTETDGAGEDMSFADLGYDSLALLETINRVERRYGVQLSDDMADTARTPVWMLGQVNAALVAGARP